MALCGFGSLYGRMTPYLHEIDLEEHYFIQRPSHTRTEVILHFAKLGKGNSLHGKKTAVVDFNTR